MRPNMGFDTSLIETGWKDVSIATEIAIFEYEESQIENEVYDDDDEYEQLNLF